ncbi:hypothetical protein RQP46_002007 [Phenoliferia psychrophenolica]
MVQDPDRPSVCYGCFKVFADKTKVLKLCSGCRHVWYCSDACSVANWPRHKRECRNIKARQDRTETTSLAAPLGESYRLESALAFRTQILPTLINFVGFACLPPTHPGEHLVLFLEFEFALDAPDLRERWKVMGEHRFWRVDDWLDYLMDESCELDPRRRTWLFDDTIMALDDIPKVRSNDPAFSDAPRSAYIITMSNFRDLPTTGEIQHFRNAFTLLRRAPCATAGIPVDWLKWWQVYVSRVSLATIADGPWANLMGYSLVATQHLTTKPEPQLTVAMNQHWESLPPSRKFFTKAHLFRWFGKVPEQDAPALAFALLWKWGEDTREEMDEAELEEWLEKKFDTVEREGVLKALRKDSGK